MRQRILRNKRPKLESSRSTLTSRKGQLGVEVRISPESSPLGLGPSLPASSSPQAEALFRDFQANLLSLISHELRTPLTGILNALGALDQGIVFGGLSSDDLIRMARENAQRLQESLNTLLDLGALEGKSFHVRLREVDLCRLARARVASFQEELKRRNLRAVWSKDSLELGALVLADSNKMNRAIDLCFQVLLPRSESGTEIEFRLDSYRLEIWFQLAKNMEKLWETTWSSSGIGLNSESRAPYAAFAGVLQSEQAFLSRVEDGFGSEFLLIHEIMKLHGGHFSAQLHSEGKEPISRVQLIITLPELSSDEGLEKALKSRATQISSELSSVCLVLVKIPSSMRIEDFKGAVQKRLFRATDTVYSLPDRNLIALILDDCRSEDAPRLMARISQELSLRLVYGSAHCPEDELDPGKIFGLALERIK